MSSISRFKGLRFYNLTTVSFDFIKSCTRGDRGYFRSMEARVPLYLGVPKIF